VNDRSSFGRYGCGLCFKERGTSVRATVRVFSGSHDGEGFPTCDEHREQTYAVATEILASPHTRIGYEVAAYKVDWEVHNGVKYPHVGKQIWRVVKK
jgi:hypothetical protein